MRKIDLKKELKHFYQAPATTVVEVSVPPLRFLMIDGRGDPNTSAAYAQAVEALYTVSYAAKFLVKNKLQRCDYTVMPLEGLWWAEDMTAFISGNRANWMWRMMIMQPDFVDDGVMRTAIEQARRKKNPAALDHLRLEVFEEGRCAQTLHVGPFAEEGPTVERVHAFVDARSARRGKHHEIYLTDVRRAAPANWKTIIRQPMT